MRNTDIFLSCVMTPDLTNALAIRFATESRKLANAAGFDPQDEGFKVAYVGALLMLAGNVAASVLEIDNPDIALKVMADNDSLPFEGDGALLTQGEGGILATQEAYAFKAQLDYEAFMVRLTEAALDE